MKRVVCLLLSAVLVFCAAGCGCGSNQKSVGKNTVYISDAEGKKGDSVTVYITATDKTPVAAYTLILDYDDTVLEMKEYGTTDEFDKAYEHGIDLNSDDSGRLIFAGANATESEERFKGDMFYATFEIIGDTAGDSELSLTLKSLTTYDEVAHVDEYTAVNGKVTVK